ncbi:sugar kinase [Sinosporangium siamense]|uniref:Carbohydrate kinase PfkB domain-containing protein n=1 Tax=Sinosporangium siamense TaxID=1367973 RepID=A0A919RPC2_9ACTN|nr:sugar kinase [Sinosporangium siamense]GII95936.1 hypothetical protein Ssi02_61670 [Sinosporangium siamense]
MARQAAQEHPTPQAVCVGESMAALLPDRPGPLDAVESFTVTVGGAESNVAGALSALGIPSAWISRVGDDAFGRRLVAELGSRGVDVSAVAVDPRRPTGLYLKEIGRDPDLAPVGPGAVTQAGAVPPRGAASRAGTAEATAAGAFDIDGTRMPASAPLLPPLTLPGGTHPPLAAGQTRAHYYRAGSAASALGPELLDDPAAGPMLAEARLLHLSGITPALSDTCLALVRGLLTARRTEQIISFDLNWRPALWHDRDPGVLPGLLDAADVLLVGADEAHAAFGVSTPTGLRRMFPSPATLVVKDSGRQVTALLRDGTAVGEPALTVDVVEATGAGDAFAAGYLAGTLRGLDHRARLRLGHLSAAAALTAHGDQGTMAPPHVIGALLAASPRDWAATRVTPDGIHSPALRDTPVRSTQRDR